MSPKTKCLLECMPLKLYEWQHGDSRVRALQAQGDLCFLWNQHQEQFCIQPRSSFVQEQLALWVSFQQSSQATVWGSTVRPHTTPLDYTSG